MVKDIPLPPPPWLHNWSAEARACMEALRRDGFEQNLSLPHPHSYVSGGIRPDRRLRMCLFYKPGPGAASVSTKPGQLSETPAPGADGPAAAAAAEEGEGLKQPRFTGVRDPTKGVAAAQNPNETVR